MIQKGKGNGSSRVAPEAPVPAPAPGIPESKYKTIIEKAKKAKLPVPSGNNPLSLQKYRPIIIKTQTKIFEEYISSVDNKKSAQEILEAAKKLKAVNKIKDMLYGDSLDKSNLETAKNLVSEAKQATKSKLETIFENVPPKYIYPNNLSRLKTHTGIFTRYADPKFTREMPKDLLQEYRGDIADIIHDIRGQIKTLPVKEYKTHKTLALSELKNIEKDLDSKLKRFLSKRS